MKENDPTQDVPERKTPATNEDLSAMEGEGSPSAARAYEEQLEQFKKEKNVEELAEEAARLLDEEPDATKAAEEIGRSKKQEPGSEQEKKAA